MVRTTALSPHIGLEILGVDLEQPLSAALQDQLRQAWISGGILLFRGGGTSADVHLRLSRVFGDLEPSATRNYNLDSNPYIMQVVQDPQKPPFDGTLYELDGERIYGFVPWHWDQTFMPTIVRGAVLRMIEPATRGGRTGFIDAIAAYERLPAALRNRIENLEVVYCYTDVPDHISRVGLGLPQGLRVLQEAAPSDAAKKYHQFPPTVHPLVITQRETGRKVLKYSPLHSQYIVGMDRTQSDELLAEISDYLADQRYAYFHDWGANDMIVWDNWRVIHMVCGAPPEVRRYAQRTTILGDYDLGRYLDPKLDKRHGVVTYVD